MLLKCIKPETGKILGKNQNGFQRKQSKSQILTIRQILEGIHTKPWGNTFIHRLLLGIWLHTQLEAGAITTSVWSPQRNCHSHNEALEKFESKSSLTIWRCRLLWHCCWCSTKGYISPISVHDLPRLCTSNVNRSNERKWLYTKKARSRWYSTETIIDADYADDIAFLANTPNQAESLQHSLEKVAGGISFHVNADKIGYICFNQKRDISTLSGSVKLVDKFMYLGSSVSSTENDINMRLAKAWTASICKSYLSHKMKCNFFQAAVVSILLYGYTT